MAVHVEINGSRFVTPADVGIEAVQPADDSPEAKQAAEDQNNANVTAALKAHPDTAAILATVGGFERVYAGGDLILEKKESE